MSQVTPARRWPAPLRSLGKQPAKSVQRPRQTDRSTGTLQRVEDLRGIFSQLKGLVLPPDRDTANKVSVFANSGSGTHKRNATSSRIAAVKTQAKGSVYELTWEGRRRGRIGQRRRAGQGESRRSTGGEEGGKEEGGRREERAEEDLPVVKPGSSANQLSQSWSRAAISVSASVRSSLLSQTSQ